MTSFFWDTNLFIYLFDSNGALHTEARTLLSGMDRRGVQLVTSALTVGELQVGPRRQANAATAFRYKNAVTSMAKVVGFDLSAADHYAAVRQTTPVRGPDALQLACAAAFGVELFITNDARLQGLQLPGIHFIVPLSTALQLL